VQDADTIGLSQTERQQLQNGGASGHRLRDALHQGGFLGTGKEPLSHQARGLIDPCSDVREKLRDVLDLIEQHREP
jgi:hypothetical protein